MATHCQSIAKKAIYYFPKYDEPRLIVTAFGRGGYRLILFVRGTHA